MSLPTPYRVGDSVWIAYIQKSPTMLRVLTFEEALEIGLSQPMVIAEATIAEITDYSTSNTVRCTLKEGHNAYVKESGGVGYVTVEDNGFLAFTKPELVLKIEGIINNFYQKKIDKINAQRRLLDMKEATQLRRKAEELNRLNKAKN